MQRPNRLSLMVALLAALWTAGARAQGPVNIASGDNTIRDQVTGEPYKMYGSRIIFTNWQYVRPANFNWVDDRGKGVAADKNANIGDWGAHFRTSDVPRGIRIAAQPAERRGDIIRKEKPWEARSISVKTMIKDGGKYKLWAGCTDAEGKANACYFESSDGIAWTRPNLGLVEYHGSKDNNLIPSLPVESVFIDPSSPPGQRYKGVMVVPINRRQYEEFKKRRPADWEPRADRRDVAPDHIYAFHGAVSPDGIRWTVLPDIFNIEHADTQNIGAYDTILKKYIIYTRAWWVGERDNRIAEGQGQVWFAVGRRSIGRTESATFGDFPLSEMVMIPTSDMPPSEVLYTNCYTTVPGAPELRLMFPSIWNQASDATRLMIAASPNGKVWDWVPGGAVLDTGEFQTFDGGCLFASPNLVELGNGDFALPYNGYRFPHKYPRGHEGFPPNLGSAVWSKGRMIALEAPEQGEFATVAVAPPGIRLRVNATTRRGGSIRIEACDVNRRPLPGRAFADCEPIIGDQFRTLVRWKGGEDLGIKPGEAVVLRFKMDQARLFALDFE
jgi:hypothetical protein